MSLIIRIDVDRPYGKHPVFRHVLSRVGSDLFFPRIGAFGYLRELREMLAILNRYGARAHVFFRRCTLPSQPVCELMRLGGHVSGLHLENSRSYNTFLAEKKLLEQYLGHELLAVSKHGSGKAKYGFHHYAPYEADKYVGWARQSGMRVFLGNLEDPSLKAQQNGDLFVTFPSAFWLEPYWRDVRAFPVDWLLSEGKRRDVVLLVHPDNVLESQALTDSFITLVTSVESKLLI